MNMDDDNSRERLEENDIEIEEGDYNERKSSSRLFERFGSETSDYDKEFGSIIKEPLLWKNRTNTTSQIAIVGSNVCTIESLDYEIVENELFKQDWRSRNRVQIFQYIFLKWTLALLIGLGTGLVGLFQ
ncbi:hypothetical protein Dsin_030556 [Dipteronia sinensis]|uniref:Uncharacterized protein n=1 Tax=Dipteronia sinensis TaxID=43782 RepID=A0AAD9ZKT2_9ROSI|nr:hypothetical protein Dsin_030556 [Dipteronia sinensis]